MGDNKWDRSQQETGEKLFTLATFYLPSLSTAILGRPDFRGDTRLFVKASICAVKCSLPKARPLLTLSLISFNNSVPT